MDRGQHRSQWTQSLRVCEVAGIVSTKEQVDISCRASGRGQYGSVRTVQQHWWMVLPMTSVLCTSGSPTPAPPCGKLPSPCISAWDLVSMIAPSSQPMRNVLACSIFLEKFHSQQNVRYLGRVEVNTIVISRDSPTSPAKPYSSFKQ